MIDLKTLKELEQKGNYKAIVDIATDIFVRMTLKDPKADEEKAILESYINSFEVPEKGNAMSETQSMIFEGVLDALCEKQGNAIIAAEKEIRNAEKIIKDGEIDELSLVKDDPRSAKKLAESYAYSQTAAGIEVNAMRLIFLLMNKCTIDGGGDQSISKRLSEKRISTLRSALESNFDDIKQGELSDEEYLGFLYDKAKAEFGKAGGFDIHSTPVAEGEELFDRKNADHVRIKQYTNEELDKAIKEKRAVVKRFYEDKKNIAALADDAKKLQEELLAINGLDVNDKAVKLLLDEVENITKYGTKEHRVLIGDSALEEGAARTNSNVTNLNSYNKALKALGELANNLSAGHLDEVDSPAKKAVLKVEQFLNEHKKTAQRIKTTAPYKQGGSPEAELETLRREKKNRLETTDAIKRLGDLCHKRDMNINSIGLYTASAQRGLDILANAAEFMTLDRNTHSKPSDSYTAFANSMADLAKLRAENTTPQKLLEKMQQTYDAAVVYEREHTGWKHPFTGYSDNGKDRIRYSQLAKTILGDKIAELSAFADKAKNAVGDNTPAAAVADLESKNKIVRESRNKLRGDLKKKNESKPFELDDKQRMALGKLASLKAKVGEGAYPDKNDIYEPIAEVILSINLKRAENTKGIKADQQLFDEEKMDMLDGPELKKLFEKYTSEQIIKQAVNNGGAELYANYAAIHSSLKNAATIADKNTEPQPQKKLTNLNASIKK